MLTKQDVVDKLNTHEFVEYALQVLKVSGTVIPKKGIYAGQALASAAYEYLQLKVSAPINDYDFFCFVPREGKAHYSDLIERQEERRNLKESVGPVLIQAGSISGMPPNISPLSKGSITITATKVIDTTNIILVSHTNDAKIKTSGTAALFRVVNCFDINCTKIGICLTSKHIYFSDEFVDFCLTRQLKITSYLTPVQSLTRLFKKIKQFKGAHCDIPFEVSMVESFKIGGYKPYGENEYNPHHVDYDLRCYAFTSDSKAERDFKEYVPLQVKETLDLQPVNTKEAFRDRGDNKNIYVMPHKPLSELSNSPIFKIHEKGIHIGEILEQNSNIPLHLNHTVSKMRPFLETVNSSKASEWLDGTSEEINAAKDAPRFCPFILSAYVMYSIICDSSMRKNGQHFISRLAKLHEKHPYLLQLVAARNEHFSEKEMTAVIKNANWLERTKKYNWVIGYLETKPAPECILKGRKEIIEWAEELMSEDPEQVQNNYLFNCRIVNLTRDCALTEYRTRLDLIQLGHEEDHCVGGYYDDVHAGTFRIFTIIGPSGKRITITHHPYEIEECSMFGSPKPTTFHQALYARNKSLTEKDEKFLMAVYRFVVAKGCGKYANFHLERFKLCFTLPVFKAYSKLSKIFRKIKNKNSKDGHRYVRTTNRYDECYGEDIPF